MGLVLDASTPSIAVQSDGTIATVATASFTPPVGTRLGIFYSANTVDPTSPSTPTITDNLGTHLPYQLLQFSARADTPAADGQAAVWTVPVLTAQAMTITVTNQAPSGSRHAALYVGVLRDDAGGVPRVGTSNKSGSISASSIAQNYTGTGSGGWGFISVIDWSAKGVMSAGTGCALIGSANVGAPDISYGFVRRTSPDGTIGGTTTLNVTLGGTSTSVRWAYAEFLPAEQPADEPPWIRPGLPVHIIIALAGYRMSWTAPDTSATVKADAGTGTLVLTGTGAATNRVATQTGRAGLALTGAGTDVKRAADAGTAELALIARSTAVKVAPDAGRAVLVLEGAAQDARRAVEAGSALLALTGTGAESTAVTRAQSGRATLALAGTAADVRRAAVAGAALMTFTGWGAVQPAGARAQAGTAELALTGAATARHLTPMAGTVVLAFTGVATEVKRVGAAGRVLAAMLAYLAPPAAPSVPAGGQLVVADSTVTRMFSGDVGPGLTSTDQPTIRQRILDGGRAVSARPDRTA